MKIRKMTAHFGTLKGESLVLGEGLNVITAPNERGKSTWCAFLKAMLYGVDTSKRASAGVLPDKTRYAAWDGSAMAGEMELLWQDREITLSRRGRANAPMRDFSAVYTGTATPVPELSGVSAGETLTGVPLSVFESSAFITQRSMRVTQGPELEKRIASIVTTGDEEVSYSETKNTLAAWQRRRRFRSGGELPETENALEEKNAQLDALARENVQIENLTKEVERSAARVGELTAQVEESRKRARKDVLARASQSRKALREAEQKADEAARRAAVARDAVERSVFGMCAPEEARRSAEETAEKCRALAQTASQTPPSAGKIGVFLALAILLLAAGVALLILKGVIGVVPLILAALDVVLLLRMKRNARTLRQEIEEAAAERQAILTDWGVQDEEALLSAAEAHAGLYALWTAAAGESKAAEEVLASARALQEKIDAQAISELDFTDGDSEAARLGRQLRFEQENLQRSREALAAAKGHLSALGDPLAIKSEIGVLDDKRARLQAEYDALAIALEVLQEADTEMQTRFFPQLGARAAELFSALTGGKYDRLTLNKKLDAQMRMQGDALAHDAAYLSAGAYDQLYLALRLAICSLTMPGGDCPLILDDALCSFDDTRCAQALSLLRELAKERQILLFTCHSREAALLADAPDVQKITL